MTSPAQLSTQAIASAAQAEGGVAVGLALDDATLGKLAKLVAEELAAKVQPPPPILTTAALASMMGVTEGCVRTWVEDGRISPCKMGGKNSFFLLDDVIEELRRNKICNPRKPTQHERILARLNR